MVVNTEKQRMRFREEAWKLLRKKTRRGPSEILRAEVEVLGASLGLAEEEASCGTYAAAIYSLA